VAFLLSAAARLLSLVAGETMCTWLTLSAQEQSMVTLVVENGPSAGKRVELTGTLIIGRDDADLTFDDPEVSRRHAAIRPGTGGLYRGAEIEDLGSTNGTFVDGVRVLGSVALKDGARVRLGDTTIVIETAAVDAGATRVRDSPLEGDLTQR
jgi:pSer/pThr/pTyr-binding forkhead associated (FHA) protein